MALHHRDGVRWRSHRFVGGHRNPARSGDRGHSGKIVPNDRLLYQSDVGLDPLEFTHELERCPLVERLVGIEYQGSPGVDHRQCGHSTECERNVSIDLDLEDSKPLR